ncbi:hypothetical protein VPH35_061750 [Triticum aestivum]
MHLLLRTREQLDSIRYNSITDADDMGFIVPGTSVLLPCDGGSSYRNNHDEPLSLPPVLALSSSWPSCQGYVCKPRGWDAHTRRSPSSPPSLALLPNSTARSQSSSTHDHPPRSSAYLIHDLCFTWYCMMCYGSIGICLQPPSDLDIE